MEIIRRRLMPGVHLTYIQERKFKTNLLSAQLVSPLRRETASANALLPAVLRRGTARYPDMECFSRVLDELYGARIEAIVRKEGETLVIGFLSDCIDEAYAPGENSMFLNSFRPAGLPFR